ncbi:MAG: hypothetical protein K0R57_3340 [Paenibacillaceae bacterium]|jgi:uncharacterized protein YpmB|nr:hypothetical protein [Paenibacillaceae bacterium]
MNYSKKMIAGWVLLIITAVLVVLYIFNDSIIASEWDDKRKAVNRAYQESMLVTADKTEPFVGAEPYVIVFGKDKLGKEMIVWVSETELHSEYAADGVTSEAVTDKIMANDPANRIIRITPGKMEDDYVWEVYYQRPQDSKTAHYYEYHRFADGTVLDTLQLGLTE